MPEISHTAHDMISGMTPELQDGVFVFVSTDDAALGDLLLPQAVSAFRESEGLSLLIPVGLARKHGFVSEPQMRCITLNVYSSLEGVGLTAAVATALADNGIPCNMIAACHHDHAFVPVEMSGRAMEVLLDLQSGAQIVD